MVPASRTPDPAPQRLVVPTCIGCGAMAIPGSCERGCAEERLELVGADSFDGLVRQATRSREAIGSFRPIAEELARPEVAAGTWEAGYRRLQSAAREALRARVENRDDPAAASQSARQGVAWSCPRCGGLEAPSPVSESVFGARWRGLLRRIAFITPREGWWKDGWQALSAAPRQTLGDVTRSPEAQTR